MTLTREYSGPVLTEDRAGDTAVVALHGEIDLGTVPEVTERLDELTSGARPDLVLDLRGVTFIDCAGLGPLCRARARAADRCGRLRLVTDSERMLRLLRRTGLGTTFEVIPSLPLGTHAA